jgi:hypothetical protein
VVEAGLNPFVRDERCARAAAAGCVLEKHSDAKVANRDARVGHGVDREWPLNDGQIPNPNGVRVALSTGYHRVEGKIGGRRVTVS